MSSQNFQGMNGQKTWLGSKARSKGQGSAT